MEKFTEEMQKLIEANLPASTAGAMKDFIKKAEETKQRLARIEDICEQQKEATERRNIEIIDLKIKVSTLNSYKSREKEIVKQEEALRIRERDIKLEIATVRLQAADDRNNKIESLVEKVFGHPSVTVSTLKTKPVMSTSDGYSPYQNGCTTENEDTTTMEVKE